MLLAHVGLGELQALLGCALGGQLPTHADDGVGLADVALLQVGDDLGVALGPRLGGLMLLVGAPEQQGEGAEQGQAVEGLAQGGHLRYQPAAFMAASSIDWISPMTTAKR